MAADAWVEYNQFKLRLGDGTAMDMDADTFKCSLHTVSTTTVTVLTTEGFGTQDGEVTGSGYVQHTFTTPTWANSGTATTTFDLDDATFTASGGSITCRYAVIYDDTVTTPVADPCICYSLLDNTPADVVVTDTNTLTIQMNASGVLTLS